MKELLNEIKKHFWKIRNEDTESKTDEDKSTYELCLLIPLLFSSLRESLQAPSAICWNQQFAFWWWWHLIAVVVSKSLPLIWDLFFWNTPHAQIVLKHDSDDWEDSVLSGFPVQNRVWNGLGAKTWQSSFAAAVFHTVATRAGLVHDSQ